jgi:hypothetical protein
MSLPPLPDIDLTSLRAAISDLRVGGHLSMDGNSRLIDELSNLRTVARSYAEEAVKQERERLSLPKSYGGSTFSTWGDQKEGCTVRLHFTDAKEAEEWVNRLTDNWDAAIRARSSMESK